MSWFNTRWKLGLSLVEGKLKTLALSGRVLLFEYWMSPKAHMLKSHHQFLTLLGGEEILASGAWSEEVRTLRTCFWGVLDVSHSSSWVSFWFPWSFFSLEALSAPEKSATVSLLPSAALPGAELVCQGRASLPSFWHCIWHLATCSMSFGSDQGMELALMLVDAST